MTTIRRGSTFLELAAALAVLAVLLGMIGQSLIWAGAERRACWRRQCAAIEAANVLERLTSLPWSEITPERAQNEKLSVDASRILGANALEVTITPEETALPAKRIQVEIHGHGGSKQFDGVTRLTTWVYRGARP
jgi:hypothetical protein